jgi:hypothetical protein
MPSPSFCILPWIHVFADESGILWPCCINLEKAVNHGGHSEKTRAYDGLSNHPLGAFGEWSVAQAFRRARRVRRG